jgi:hypothetical protein
MASIINAATSGGLTTTADTSGILQLQTAGTTAVTVDASQNVTFVNSASLPNTFGFKNRIINGAMVIDQRNSGSAVTPTAAVYSLDRWNSQVAQSNTFSVQQSTTAPTGFINSLLVTSLAATSVGVSENSTVEQYVEGLNCNDFSWGTASAQVVTLSFWVRSSLTGTFGGCLQNSDNTRSYVFSYTISAANTWEQKSVTIAGDTSGTWLTTNGIGIKLRFSIGVGTNLQTTAGSWASANYRSVTGETQVLATNGATWRVSGVQLEKGSTATSFDVRPYTTELQLCQRYCWVSYTTSGNGGPLGTGAVYSTTLTQVALHLPVSMRTTPTATTVLNGSSIWCQSYIGATGTTTATAPSVQTDLNNFQNVRLAIDGLSGMTAGQASWTFTAANAKLILSAEL